LKVSDVNSGREKVQTHLHETTSHITSFSSLDGGIDKSFSTRDGVEEELGSSETRVERVGNETFGERVDGSFREMRK